MKPGEAARTPEARSDDEILDEMMSEEREKKGLGKK